MAMDQPLTFRHRPSPRRGRDGFTLTELLIVIGITVLVLALAVPAFNAITGSRSLESAENRIAAILAQARMTAIAQRAPHGVAFYRDRASQRVTAAIVACNPATGELELLPDVNPQALPAGVGIAFQHVTNPGALNLTDNDYIYDSIGYPDDDSNFFGVILFDAAGRFEHRAVGVDDASEFGRRLGLNDDLDAGYPGAGNDPIYSQPAFLLFESSVLEPVLNAAPQERVKTLNDNATVILVNRYNGSLTASE